jgi:hypothetical protein
VLPALFACSLAALGVAHPSTASALQNYPGLVDTALGSQTMVVEKQIAPPMGCQLCHTSPIGGTTTLSAFGNVMVSQYGFPDVGVSENALAQAALAKLEATEPKLWKDMQAGIDPNSDPVFTDQAPPQPQYGCSAAPQSTPEPFWLSSALACFACLAFARRRRL